MGVPVLTVPPGPRSPRPPECGTAPNVTTILLAVVGSILLIGFVLLGIWKLLVTIHDRREFAKFQSERSRARYEMVSRWDVGSRGGNAKYRGLAEFRQVAFKAKSRTCTAACALLWSERRVWPGAQRGARDRVGRPRGQRVLAGPPQKESGGS